MSCELLKTFDSSSREEAAGGGTSQGERDQIFNIVGTKVSLGSKAENRTHQNLLDVNRLQV